MKLNNKLQKKELESVYGGSHEPLTGYCPKCKERFMRDDAKFVKSETGCGDPIYAYRCPACGYEFDECD